MIFYGLILCHCSLCEMIFELSSFFETGGSHRNSKGVGTLHERADIMFACVICLTLICA